MRFLSFLLLIFGLISQIRSELELIQDDELVNLIRSEKYVVALFTKKFCEECENYENELTGLREDLVETLNAWVVKLIDSSMTRLYTPDKEPAIIFFRHGVPLLYDGPLNDELIFHTFTNNKEPAAKELNDDTFEHLTQAASGATTGDWFIQFYTTDCVECQRLQARWESVGAQLKSRLNVARVNRATTGARTARRFDVFEVPAFILFKKGKMYRYHNQDFNVKSFVAFTQDCFPKDLERRKLWVANTKIKDWEPTNNDRLCSKHFEDCYFYKTDQRVIACLPKLFLLFYPSGPQYLQPKKITKRKRTRENSPLFMELSTSASISSHSEPFHQTDFI